MMEKKVTLQQKKIKMKKMENNNYVIGTKPSGGKFI